jgi:hypothetical protein
MNSGGARRCIGWGASPSKLVRASNVAFAPQPAVRQARGTDLPDCLACCLNPKGLESRIAWLGEDWLSTVSRRVSGARLPRQFSLKKQRGFRRGHNPHFDTRRPVLTRF